MVLSVSSVSMDTTVWIGLGASIQVWVSGGALLPKRTSVCPAADGRGSGRKTCAGMKAT